MTTYSISEIATITKATALQTSNVDYTIAHLLTDSRKLSSATDTLFFAITGNRLDGHHYIEDLYNKGVRAFVVSNKIATEKLKDASFLLVPNTIDALQKIAAHHRAKFEFPVIGITGSNGKTIVKEWLYQLLHEDYNIVRSPKSYNSQIGVPLSVWQMNESNTMAVFEAGISEPGEMDKLEKIIHPNIGIFTNVGDAHNESFLNIKHKTKEKLQLFKHSDVLIYCKDHAHINGAVAEVNSVNNRIKTFTWSSNADAEVKITSIMHANNHTFISCFFKHRVFDFEIPFSDKASVENAIHCAVTMLYLDVEPDVIAARMKLLSPIAMRLEMKDGINNCILINDSYNSDFGSIRIAIDFLGQQNRFAKRTIILSDILQSGEGEIELYERIAKIIQQAGVQKFVGIGAALTRQKRLFELNTTLESHFYTDTETFLKNFDSSTFNNETILLKGARKFRFEIISKLLEKKAHETVLEINLNAIAHNLKAFQSILKPKTKIMCMVKAFAYGSGSYEVANVLQFNRADYLAVAYTDEGIELRRNGIHAPIMVMNPEQRSFEAMIAHKLEPDLYSHRIFDSFMETLNMVHANGGEPFNVHIELETGMHRLGFDNSDIPLLIQKITANNAIKVASIFSHLAASENDHEDSYTKKQIATFEQYSSQILNALAYKPLRHILNSTGITRHTNAQYDMVRLGIGLYGIDDSGVLQKNLQPVSTLKTTISQIKHLQKGDTVGYGRVGKATQNTSIATVAIGYADGLSRKLNNGVGSMLVRGRLASVIGNVCMDMTMLNITDIPDAAEGDEVIVFGENPSILNIAKAAGTIPYEILTGISQRVKRVYFEE
jgi:alanine racemase